MKTGYLGVGVVLIGVFMLAMTTLTWVDVAVVAPSPEGLALPERIRSFTGVEVRPGSVPASLATMAAGAVLLVVGAAGRVAGRLGRTIAIAVASLTILATIPVLVVSPDVDPVAAVVRGGGAPDPATGAAAGAFYGGLVAAVVLCGLAWRLREPPVAAPDSSSYTVEAVTATATEDDEWELADASVRTESATSSDLPPTQPHVDAEDLP